MPEFFTIAKSLFNVTVFYNQKYMNQSIIFQQKRDKINDDVLNGSVENYSSYVDDGGDWGDDKYSAEASRPFRFLKQNIYRLDNIKK